MYAVSRELGSDRTIARPLAAIALPVRDCFRVADNSGSVATSPFVITCGDLASLGRNRSEEGACLGDYAVLEL